jgi:cytochrome c-type biogenesis protein CcmH
MRPPFNVSTAALWLAPFILALASLLIGWVVLSASRRRKTVTGLSAAEEAEVAQFIEQNKVSEKT